MIAMEINQNIHCLATMALAVRKDVSESECAQIMAMTAWAVFGGAKYYNPDKMEYIPIPLLTVLPDGMEVTIVNVWTK